MKVALAVLSLVIFSATAFPIAVSPEKFASLPAKFETGEAEFQGIFDIVTGFFVGFAQTAKEDVMAFPDCVLGFPCAFSVISEFAEYLKEMKHFDIKEVATKFYSLVIMGTIGCLQSCMIPYTYYMHFQPFFKGFNWKTFQKFLINGLLYNAITIIYNGQDAVKDFMQKDYYECGMNLGIIFWCVLIR